MEKRKWRTLISLRKLLTCAICLIGLIALFSAHVPRVLNLPDPYKLPTQQETKFRKLNSEHDLGQANAPPHAAKSPLYPFNWCQTASGSSYHKKLWKPPPNRDFVPCIGPSNLYTPPADSQGYLLVHTNGGLKQMQAGV